MFLNFKILSVPSGICVTNNIYNIRVSFLSHRHAFTIFFFLLEIQGGYSNVAVLLKIKQNNMIEI